MKTEFKITELQRGDEYRGFEVEAVTEGFSDGFIVLDCIEQLKGLRNAIDSFLKEENGSLAAEP